MLCWLISLFIISRFQVFVKYFFKFFQKNFFRDRHSEKRLNYYTTVSFVCQPLFRSFFKPVVSSVSDNLIIIPLPNGFVKRFFKLFKEFLQTYLSEVQKHSFSQPFFRSRSTALLLYHRFYILSIKFFSILYARFLCVFHNQFLIYII